MNIPNTAQSAHTFSHFQRSMKRVGVAKLPLSMPAPSASIAAPEDPIIRVAIGAIGFASDERLVYRAPRSPVNPIAIVNSAGLFVEARSRYVIFLSIHRLFRGGTVRLKGRVALVSGAAMGIGKGIASL